MYTSASGTVSEMRDIQQLKHFGILEQHTRKKQIGGCICCNTTRTHHKIVYVEVFVGIGDGAKGRNESFCSHLADKHGQAEYLRFVIVLRNNYQSEFKAIMYRGMVFINAGTPRIFCLA